MHLTSVETKCLDRFVDAEQITPEMLPVGASVGLDSMGPMRNSKTDTLYPGAREALGRFSETLRARRLILCVATNGPDIEGEEILNSLVGPVAAFAVTEGGGKLISRRPQTGGLEHTLLAMGDELERLRRLEEKVRKHPLMNALLGDNNPLDGKPPIRTPYQTNIVVTLPTDLDVLSARLVRSGVNLQDYLPGANSNDYVKKVLGYAHDQYTEAILTLGIGDAAAVLTKAQNRRTYVTPRHTLDTDILSKASGARLGSEMMSREPGYHQIKYEVGNSIYIADKAVERTEDGQPIIGPSERSMIIAGPTWFPENYPNPDNIKVINLRAVGEPGRRIYLGDVAARLAMNVTLTDDLPRMDQVETVDVLHIGSGNKALEAITHLYKRLHG